MSNTNSRAAQGLLEVALHLEKGGHQTFIPLGDDHSQVDLVAIINGKARTIQVKYCSFLTVKRSLSLKNGHGVDYVSVYFASQRDVKYLKTKDVMRDIQLNYDSTRWEKSLK